MGNKITKILSVMVFLVMVTTVFAVVMPMNMSTTGSGGNPGLNYEAYFRARSSNDVWGKYTRLSFTPSDTKFAMVASNGDFDPDYLVVVFADNLTGQYEWYFTKSLDSGATWSAPEIAVDPDFDILVGEIYSAAIDMSNNGIVHMSFMRAKEHATDQPTGIYYARYDGVSWYGPITIEEIMNPGYYKLYTNDITVGKDNDTIHVVYGSDCLGWTGPPNPSHDDGDTWYSKSTDGGDTWSAPVNINQDNGMDVGYRPSIAADGNGNVYKANDGGWPGRIWFRRSQNDGISWNTHQQIGNPPYEHRQPITMCDDNGGVYIIYMREEAGSLSLMYKYSNDHGSTWTPSQNGGYTLISSVPGMDYWYLADVDDSGFIHIVYGSTETGIMEAYYMKIDAQGNTVVPSEIITPDDGNPSYPTGLVVAGGHVYVATRDPRVGKVPATIDIDPNTLNLKSKGRWITCYIELPEGYNVKDINASTILLEDTLSPILNPKYGFVKSEDSYIMDHDNDSILERMVKFDRSEVEDMLLPGTYNLKVTGQLTDGTLFEGYSDTIRVIDPGVK